MQNMIQLRINGFDLVLIKCMDGWSYEWQDNHGKVACCGWSRGTKNEARREAVSHLQSKP